MSNCGISLLLEDILEDIFIRLPVKSIGKSRCVSKHWNSLLTSPRFIKTQLARSHQKKLLLLCDECSLFTFTLRPDGVAEGTFEKPNSIPQYSTLVGHCNGLVLIATGERFHLLMNPTTLEHSRLPESPNSALGPRVVRLGHAYGFGYDSSGDDYKVVNIFVGINLEGMKEFSVSNLFIFADIYSVKKKCWRRIDLDSPRYFANGRHNGLAGVFVNGALHWLPVVSYETYPTDVIRAMDLSSENFYKIPSLGALRCVEEHNYVNRLISSKGGSLLGMVCLFSTEARIDIWTMNKYGMADSWTKDVSVALGSFWGIGTRPLCWRDALVIQYPYDLTFYSFNDARGFSLSLDTETFNDLLEPLEERDVCNVYEIEGGDRVGGLIVSETLVSPHHFDSQQCDDEEEQSPSILLCNKKLKELEL